MSTSGIFLSLNRAVGAFLESKDSIEELLQGKQLDLSFQGIDDFKNVVGFVKLAEGDCTAMLMEISGRQKKLVSVDINTQKALKILLK